MNQVQVQRRDEIHSFNLSPDRIVAGKYVVEERIGQGWEGEVYRVRHKNTGIEYAAKLFFPQNKQGNRAVTEYALKMHRLRNHPMIVRYHTEETISFRKKTILVHISEYVEGDLLSDYVASQRGHRLSSFEALHVLYALTKGVAQMHYLKEYHGDLHTGNVIVVSRGLQYDLKLLDTYYYGASSRQKMAQDVLFIAAILHEITGGARHYKNQPPVIKSICKGLKHALITKQFKNAIELQSYLEQITW